MKARVCTYTSRRHYGGRDIITTSHAVSVRYIREQASVGQPHIVQLLERVGAYPVGHIIAIGDNDIISWEDDCPCANQVISAK